MDVQQQQQAAQQQAAQQQVAQQQMQQQLQQQQQQFAQQQAFILQLQQQLVQAQQQAAAAAPRPSQPRIAAAPIFKGSATALDGWLREMRQQCAYYQIAGDAEKIRFCSAQLRDAALDWWDSLDAAAKAAHSASLAEFEKALRARFQPVNNARLARRQLDELQQGARQSVHDYISAFRRLLTPLTDMSEADRVHAFARGLRRELQARLIEHDPSTLDAAISLAARLGSLSQFAAGSHSSGGAARGDAMDLSNVEFHGIEGLEESTAGEDESEAVGASDVVRRSELNALLQQQHKQLLAALQQQRGSQKGKPRRGGGSNKVPGFTPEQVRERYAKGQCFACGESGHFKANCPSKPKN
jgi:hypothetical protein